VDLAGLLHGAGRPGAVPAGRSGDAGADPARPGRCRPGGPGRLRPAAGRRGVERRAPGHRCTHAHALPRLLTRPHAPYDGASVRAVTPATRTVRAVQAARCTVPDEPECGLASLARTVLRCA